MDLDTVTDWTTARTRADLSRLGPGAAALAGGTWLFGEPQPGLRRLVDLTGMGWPALVEDDTGLEVAATCTVTCLDEHFAASAWPTAGLVAACVRAFASSPKVWQLATVGGNVCLALPAGPMISLLTALDATALLWAVDGRDRRVRVEDLVTGPSRNDLAAGEVVRSFHVPARTLAARTAYRRLALTREGRSGVVVVGRSDPDGAVALTVTAGTARPVRLGFAAPPTRAALSAAVDGVDCWYDDHHGSAAWREAMARRLTAEVVGELAAGEGGTQGGPEGGTP